MDRRRLSLFGGLMFEDCQLLRFRGRFNGNVGFFRYQRGLYARNYMYLIQGTTISAYYVLCVCDVPTFRGFDGSKKYRARAVLVILSLL